MSGAWIAILGVTIACADRVPHCRAHSDASVVRDAGSYSYARAAADGGADACSGHDKLKHS